MFNFFMIVLEQSLIYLPLVCGAYISFSLLKVPDLSLETAYLIGALFGATTLSLCQGYSLLITFAMTMGASLLGGMLVGFCSSCITSYGKVPHLLSSIITFGLFHGLFQLCSYSYQSLAAYDNVLMIYPLTMWHPELGALAVIGIIIIMLCSYVSSTQLGYSFAIFGHNPAFFQHFNISKRYVFIMGIVLANALAGLAGFLFAQTSNLIELNMGIGKSLFCITALVLGRSIISSVKNSVLIPVSGSVAYFLLQQFLLKVGFNLKFFTMVQSLVILAILLSIYKKNSNQHDQLGI